MHRSSSLKAQPGEPLQFAEWNNIQPLEEWLHSKPIDSWKEFFTTNGYLVVDHLVSEEELENYRKTYDFLLNGTVDASKHRHDLGNHAERKSETENITQIMWPSVYVENLQEGPVHQRAEAVAKLLLGQDMAFDFDMLIAKAAHTDTCTPFHQDEAYWPDLSDKRAVSVWVPMEEATVDNGCMWFIPGSHQELCKSWPVKKGCHVLMCDGSEKDAVACPLKAGSATFHHGRTCHYTRGNTTDKPRRAFITNFRPTEMVQQERELGFDHAKQGGVHTVIGKGKAHDVACP